jgi:V/A-type H+-transporting ATPase subunit E
MANSSIYEKIENKGALDAKKITEAGQTQAEKQMQDAILEANREIENLKEKHLKQNNEKIKTKSTQIEQLAKQRTLFEKKKLIEEVFTRSLEKLQTMNDAQLEKLLKGLLANDALDGNEFISVSKDDKNKYLKLFSSKKDNDLDLLNKSLGPKYNLKLAEVSADINGGFIVIGKDYDINHSYQAILDEIKETNEAEIAKALFSKGN